MQSDTLFEMVERNTNRRTTGTATRTGNTTRSTTSSSLSTLTESTSGTAEPEDHLALLQEQASCQFCDCKSQYLLLPQIQQFNLRRSARATTRDGARGMQALADNVLGVIRDTLGVSEELADDDLLADILYVLPTCVIKT